MFAPSYSVASTSTGGGSGTYTSPVPAGLGVTRSRTLLFQSIRDSLAPMSSSTAASAPLLGGDQDVDGGRKPGGMYFDATGELRARDDTQPVSLNMDDDGSGALPPRWVDVSEEVDAILAAMEPKLAQLDRLHAKHLLPSFEDKTEQERAIEALTEEVTLDFRSASRQIAKLASHTTEAIRSRTLSSHEVTAARNAQTALATKVQQMSSLFRKKQSLYLRRLQGVEVQEADMRAAADPHALGPGGVPGSELAVKEDAELSRQLSGAPGQSQTALLLEQEHEDTNLAMIQERDREITQIARSIGELAQLFQDLSALVIEQGSVLDRIDYNIDNMATNVRQSGVELDQAMSYQAGSGRRQLILLLVLCIALLVVIIIVKPFFR